MSRTRDITRVADERAARINGLRNGAALIGGTAVAGQGNRLNDGGETFTPTRANRFSSFTIRGSSRFTQHGRYSSYAGPTAETSPELYADADGGRLVRMGACVRRTR